MKPSATARVSGNGVSAAGDAQGVVDPVALLNKIKGIVLTQGELAAPDGQGVVVASGWLGTDPTDTQGVNTDIQVWTGTSPAAIKSAEGWHYPVP
jgi:hypothetical protein